MVASYWYAANSFSLQCRAQQQWNVKLLLAVHCSGVVRRGLLLRDELGRPQWAAISNNLPSLGSTPYSQLQCVALPKNYPHYPRTTQCTSAVVGLSLEWWPFVRRHLESPGWGRGCRHYPQWIGGGAKQKLANQPTKISYSDRTSGDKGTLHHLIDCCMSPTEVRHLRELCWVTLALSSCVNCKLLYVAIFSCPEQLNRWPCHSLTHWLTEPPFDFWH